MNIIVIISDTLRKDHLACYGNSRVSAPNLEAFAKEALVFENFYAGSFPTVPARADIMTGRYTFTYLPWGPLPQNEKTLAQCLSAAGYLTFGIGDNPFLMRNGYGLDRGFQDFVWVRGQRVGPSRDDVLQTRRSEEDYFSAMTMKGAAEWLERHHREKFFLYVDTWEPHEPWDPPDYYVRPYFPDYAGEIIDPVYWDYREAGVSERDLEIAHACYCGEITMMDRWFGFLRQRLETLGLLSNTAVLFTSDHGFSFGDHGQFGKRRFRWPGNLSIMEGFAQGFQLQQGVTFRSPIHNELSQVPFLCYLPTTEARRVSGLGSWPDLMPTILELAGAAVPSTVQARSLLPLLKGVMVHDFVVTSAPFETLWETARTVDDKERQVIEYSPSTITDGEWDFIYSIQGEPIELYRTKEDPTHLNNVAGQNREVAERLHAKFLAWLERLETAPRVLAQRQQI